MKKSLSIDSTESLPVVDTPINEGVVNDRRQTCETDGIDRPDWSAPVFRYTSKVG